MQQEAMSMLQKTLQADAESLPWGLCLFDETWHQGVIGILASRIKDKYHRPTIVFADVGDGQIKGSARSVTGFHIRDALDVVAARHPHLLQKFGGHAMAAGMSLMRENFDDFAQAFDEEVRRQLNHDDLQAIVVSDGELGAQDFSLQLASQLRDAGPWGQHFPEPTFDGEFYLQQQKLVGTNHLKMTLSIDVQGQQLIDAIAFNIDPALWPNLQLQKVRAAFKLDINEFRGKTNVQLLIDYLEPVVS
jgi:single-stranded-DNA-specific exonuclease